MARPKKPTTNKDELLREIREYERLAKASEAAAKPREAISAQTVATRLRAEVRRIDRLAEIALIADPIARLRASSLHFAEEGQATAAQKAEVEAARLEIQAEAARAALASAEMQGLSLDDLMQIVLDTLPQLPRANVQSIYATAQGILMGSLVTLEDEDDV